MPCFCWTSHRLAHNSSDNSTLEASSLCFDVVLYPFRPQTDEEKVLKVEIDNLKALTKEAELGINSKVVKLSSEELSRLHEEIANKESDLELLACQLDDKVRFGQKVTANSRPGSAAGRSDTSSTRPPSRSGMSESSKSVEFVDAPQSRSGTEDALRNPMNDRRGLHGRRDRGFFDSRNGNRSSAREGW
ncbi:eukaryotic translation initiation factor 4B2-like [Curcuma longa]|uniref:eukaryotic translation initiation factor 4B2-like n=1 Tax=Curcuma longa TaxID=136217 RepID=UPI003D9F6D2E